ncbi:MAG: hypothetical protein AAGL69_03695 [Pseudomonadota bacterium]
MLSRTLIVAFALGITACASSELDEPVVAGEPVATTTTPAATAATPEEEVICRKEQRTGSRFYREVCFTRAQIEARADADKDALRQMRSVRSGSQSDVGN